METVYTISFDFFFMLARHGGELRRPGFSVWSKKYKALFVVFQRQVINSLYIDPCKNQHGLNVVACSHGGTITAAWNYRGMIPR